MTKQSPFRRVLLKLSGETLRGDRGFGIDGKASEEVALYLQRIRRTGTELAVVIGGGNIFRGIDLQSNMQRTPADHMGMLATLLNGIALAESLRASGAEVCVMSALDCPRVAESYNWRKADRLLSEGVIVIFVGGTGNPYFTTDSAAALRAGEMNADVLLKATKVDGIYDKDPLKYPDAKKYTTISYSQVLAEKLQVMDATAIALCRSSQIPIFVFNMSRLIEDPVEEILNDRQKGTWVSEHQHT